MSSLLQDLQNVNDFVNYYLMYFVFSRPTAILYRLIYFNIQTTRQKIEFKR